MSEHQQQQNEEHEVLLSIYEGDPNFKQIDNRYQYKFGNDGEPESFLLEIVWPETYPMVSAMPNMDAFYNTHLPKEFKERVINTVNTEAEALIGEAMTYTLIEKVRESLVELTEGISFEKLINGKLEKNEVSENQQPVHKSSVHTKENLSKAQKRRMWDKAEAGTAGKLEKPRGSDWVDLIKHLSQTGPTT